jgi:hypothetical protein
VSSADTVEKIRRLLELVKERDELRALSDGRQYPTPADFASGNADEVRKVKRLPEIEKRIDELQQSIISDLLSLLNLSSTQLEESTRNLIKSVEGLKSSSDSQLVATKELVGISKAQSDTTRMLEASSRRIELLTGFLILGTFITLFNIFFDYFAPSSALNQAREVLAVLTFVALITFLVLWHFGVLGSYRKSPHQIT